MKNREIESDEEFNPPICLITESFCDIFRNMHEGTSIYEVMRDNSGKINNLKVMYFNHASILNEITSLKKAVGKTLEELFGKEIDIPYLEIADKVISTGKGVTFETFFEPNSKYFLISAFSPNPDLYITLSLDITENKKYEIALKESEKDFRALVENSPNGVTRFDRSLRHTFINPAGAQMTGLSPEDYIGKTHHELGLPKELTNQVTDLLKRIFKTGNPETFEFEIPAPEGPKYYISNNIPEFDENGNVKSILAIAHDITNIKKAEKKLENYRHHLEELVEKRTKELENAYEALSESEEKFREIFNNANDMITLSELQENRMPGKFIEVNEVAHKILGYSKEELLNMTPSDIVDPDATVSISDIALEMSKKGYARHESIFIAKNGSKIPVEITTRFFKLRGKDVILAVSRDITERKKAEEALKESEGKFRALFNKATDTIVLSEVKENGMPGQFIEVNEAASRGLGYSKDEFENMTPTDLFAPDDRDQLPKIATELQNKGYTTFEAISITKDRKEFPVEVNVHVFKLGEKNVAIAIARDITERKNAEIERNKFIEELKRSNDELQQFAYISSHDLQEPLRTIASFTQLLERRYKNKLDQDADEFIEYIVDATKRMQNLIKDLLEYSRITTRSGEFKLISMEKVVKSVLNNLRTIVTENNAEITYDPLPEVVADENQIIRVFQNLITNSIKFKKPDEPPKIHISSIKDEENNEYVFSVSDNGIGIEKQYFDRIFTIFQRLHSRDEYKGTGIGLAVVKRIIERHGGRIWVESEPGKGSTFYFTISTNLEQIMD